MSVLGKIGRGIFNVLGIVELVVDGYDLVAGWFKKPSRKVKDLLDAQEDDEVIPLRRVIRHQSEAWRRSTSTRPCSLSHCRAGTSRASTSSMRSASGPSTSRSPR
jgi:hypothetical protein